MTIFKAAAIQMRSGTDTERNAAAFEALVREAASNGATYVQTPEMTGALVRDKDARHAPSRSEDRDLDRAGRRAAFGRARHLSACRLDRDPARRRQARQPRACCSGRTAASSPATTRSTCSTSTSTMARAGANRRPMSPATEAVVADLPFGRIGFAICYDVRFPQLFRAEALAGAEVLTVPAAFTRQTGQAHWHVLLRARAIENGAFVIAAAQGGAARGRPRDFWPFADRRSVGQASSPRPTTTSRA